VLPNIVAASGGTVNVEPNGTCVAAPGLPVIATDATGHTAIATIANIPGTTAVPDLSVSPSTVTLSSCTGQASATVAGGVSSTYFVTSGSDVLDVSITGSTVTIGRHNPSNATAGPLSVAVSDGATTKTITVNLDGAGAGICGGLTATPSTVTLTDCRTALAVGLSGGTGAYTASSDNTAVQAHTGFINGAWQLTVARTSTQLGFGPSGAFTPPATVTILNGTARGSVTVNATGDALNACP
jgi:hypothetical protein